MTRSKAPKHDGTTHGRGGWPGLCLAIVAMIGVAAAMIVLAWLAGRVMSDRFLWSQWLLWIPTPVALAAAALATLTALRPARRKRTRTRRALIWACLALAVGVYFAFFEHRLLARSDPEPGGLRLVHWNMMHLQYGDNDAHIRRVIAMDGDVSILTNAGPARYDRRYVDWLGDSFHSLTLGPFTVLSRFPITSSNMLAHEGSISLALITVGIESDREIAMLLVDLPSDKSIRRSQLADDVLRLLNDAKAPRPDVIVGDFNMTRGSASMKRMFPIMHHAYDDAGSGLGASYPRRRPIVHIDHILLADSMRATGYELINPGLSRHRAQIAHLERR